MHKESTYIVNCGYERTNYGAVLTAFALQETLSDLFNIDSKNIDIIPSLNKALGIKNIGFNSVKNINSPKEYIKFFSYENVADMTYKIYEKVVNEK